MKAVNNTPEPEADSTGILFYFLIGVLGLAFVVMVGFLFYSVFI